VKRGISVLPVCISWISSRPIVTNYMKGGYKRQDIEPSNTAASQSLELGRRSRKSTRISLVHVCPFPYAGLESSHRCCHRTTLTTSFPHCHLAYMHTRVRVRVPARLGRICPPCCGGGGSGGGCSIPTVYRTSNPA